MKKNFKTKALIMTLLVGMIAITGCGQGKKADDKIVIGLSMNTLNNPFFVDVKDGVEKGAKDNGMDIIITDAQNDPSKQMADVENLIQKKVDIILIDPADSDAIVAAIEIANEAGIPVITMDREANGGIVVSHLGFNAIKSGNIAGDFIAEAVGANGKVVEIQGILGTNVAQDRSQGFNEAMGRNSGIQIVAQQSGNFDRAEAMKVMENILQANAKIDGVYAANDEMALGVLEAIEGAGRLDEITVIGCDAIDPAIEALKAGKLEATIAEPPFFLGKTAAETALKHLNAEEVEKTVILDSNLVTSDNVESIKTKE